MDGRCELAGMTLRVVPLLCCMLVSDGAHRQQPLAWWQTEHVYQIYPRSFRDSDGNGVGDLRGIEQKLDYLLEIGTKIVWISPIFASPMKDFGYDISDFRAIDPVFGTMEDFDSLLAAMKRRGMYLVLDFVPNHSSDQHEWFKRSVLREAPYTDYYVWVDAKPDGSPPNNWLRKGGKGSAWEWVEERGQYYYHQYLPSQPDLNYRSAEVRREMEDVMRFWFDKGVDGFRLDALKSLVEVEDLRDKLAVPGTSGDTFHGQVHENVTELLPETLEVVASWRRLCDQYQARDGHHRLLMAEVYASVPQMMSYYGDGSNLTDFPLNFLLTQRLRYPEQVRNLTGSLLADVVSDWLDNMPPAAWPNWVLGSHDENRVGSRLGESLVDVFNMLVLLLPGTSVTYYGEEIGMTDMFLTYDQTVDVRGREAGAKNYTRSSRDPERTPMQWNSLPSAGFSDNLTTWLPVKPTYPFVNVELQRAADRSHLKVFSRLTALRANSPALTGGQYKQLIANDKVFAFLRYVSLKDRGQPAYIVLLNVADETVLVDLTQSAVSLSGDVAIVLRSSRSLYPEGVPLDSYPQVPLGPKEGAVLRYVPTTKDMSHLGRAFM